MKYDILSLFPEYFDSPFGVSILKRAREKGLLSIHCRNIRDFAEGKHKQVDDRPYGGGPGMLLMAEPLVKAIRSVRSEKSYVIYLSPQGNRLTAAKCKELSKKEHLVLVCGHYEGIDQRVIDLEIDEEICVGDCVLTSGCPAATVLVDGVSRFIPGVIGNPEAAYHDTFENQMFDTPHYTRPEIFEGLSVPEVLRQGHHQQIEDWRKEQAEHKTRQVRPDLLQRSY